MKRAYQIDVQLHHQTEKAVLVSTDGDKDSAVWIPKSKCELEPIHGKPAMYELTADETVLVEKGLV